MQKGIVSMTIAQIKVETLMNEKIRELKQGMKHLIDRDVQPDGIGNLYNGILKHNVEFEIQHMEHLRDELMNLFQ